MLAAETMDEAAIFTIDAWCQRMLREHAFDSGSLFDEELVSDERALFEDAAHDYWRQNVYPLDSDALRRAAGMLAGRRRAQAVGARTGAPHRRAGRRRRTKRWPALIARVERAQLAELARLKQGWTERADAMEQWIAAQRELAPKCFNGNKLRPDSLVKWFDALRAWAGDPAHADAGDDRHRLAPPDAGRHRRRLQQGRQPRGAGVLRGHHRRCGRRSRRIEPLSHALYPPCRRQHRAPHGAN